MIEQDFNLVIIVMRQRSGGGGDSGRVADDAGQYVKPFMIMEVKTGMVVFVMTVSGIKAMSAAAFGDFKISFSRLAPGGMQKSVE